MTSGERKLVSQSTGASEERRYKYDAFISYRHIKPDMIIAEKLHKAIETFKVPRALRADGKAHDYRVFRDRDELATRDLSDSLDEALEDSEFLIVICSKRTPESYWCTREAELFKKTHPHENIIPILIEGEPSDSFSEPLQNLEGTRVNEDGSEEIVSLELLAADLRPDAVKAPEFPGYAELEAKASPELEKLADRSVDILKKSEIYRIMATMLGVSYGDLKQRHRERRMRIMIAVGAIIIASLLVFGTFMTRMFIRATNAEQSANEQISLMTMDYAKKANDTGNRVFALLLGEKAMESSTPDMDQIDRIKAQHMTVMNDALFYPAGYNHLVLPVGTDSPFFSLGRNSDWVLTGGLGNDANFWNLDNGAIIRTLTLDASVASVAAAYKTDRAAIATVDGRIHLVDTTTFEYETFDGDGLMASEMAFSYGDTYLFTRSDRFGITVYHADDMTIAHQKPLSLENNLRYVAISPDERTYVLSTSNGDVIEYDLESGEKARTIVEGAGRDGYVVTILRFSRDGSKLVVPIRTPDDEGALRVFDRTTGTHQDLLEGNLRFVTDFVLDPEAEVAYVLSGGDVAVYSLETMEYVRALFTTDIGQDFQSVRISTDGDTVAALDDRGKVYYWNGLTAENAEGTIYAETSDPTTHAASVVSSAFTPDGEHFVSSSLDTTIRVGNIRGTLTESRIPGRFLATSPNHRFVLVATEEATLGLFDWQSREFRELTIQDEFVDSFFVSWAVSDDGGLVARTSISDMNALIFDTESGTAINSTRTFDVVQGYITIVDELQFIEDSQKILTAHYDRIRISDTRTGETLEEFVLENDGLFSVLADPGGAYGVANFTDDTAQIIDLKTGESVASLTGRILQLDVTDGQLVSATTDRGGTFYRWTPDGEVEAIAANAERRGTQSSSLNVDVVSHDGDFLITSTSDNKLILTDMATGERIRTFASEAGGVPRGTFDPAGSAVAYDMDDESMVIVDVHGYNELEERARTTLDGRELTDAELRSIGRSR